MSENVKSFIAQLLIMIFWALIGWWLNNIGAGVVFIVPSVFMFIWILKLMPDGKSEKEV